MAWKWRGRDGVKARLSDTIQNAVYRHGQYCEDFLSAGEMRVMALKKADKSSGF
jgi:hypothetical protein